MSEITDLDILVGHTTVRFGGKEWKLPADIPMPLMLYLESLEGRDITNELLVDLYERVLPLFQVHQPDITELPIGGAQLLALIPAVYSPTPAPEPGPTRPKPAAKRAGTRSTSTRPKSRASKSRSSS